ncbi:MAG: transglycosylase domain-containing protein, partial [Eubacterium sp.]|nr:transglycosylase domain-containing protein [Eubacterium sp.]
QRSIRRKLSEMYIAWRIEQALTKDQILEAYLNTIYLGYSNYGVNAAAKTYFSKNVNELNLAECAALAALPQAPDTYALISNDKGEASEPIPDTDVYSNDVSKDRRNLVLSLMQEQGYITEKEAKKADVDIIDLLKPTFEVNDSKYTYFTDYVSDALIKDLMAKYNMTEEEAQRMVYTGGLKIYTTLDSEIQDIITTEFENDYNFPSTVDGSEVQASMVITEVGSGYITAMVGGRNTTGSKLFNRALSPRQPGSSIKPLSVYGAALQKSYDYASKKQPFPFVDYHIDNQGIDRWGEYITAGSTVVDEPLTFNGETWPQNVTRYFSGWNTFRTALQQSINTCAVKILLQVGTDYSIDMLEKFGITTVVSDTSESVNDVNPAALALGAMTYGVTPLEMSLAYAAFPNGGVRNSAVCYTQVFDRKGKAILFGESERTTVMDQGVAWIMTDLLKSVVSDGIAGNAYIWGTETGGKTGTTNDRYDVWFDGFTPSYSASLWIGTDLNVEMTSGSWMASRLWGNIMKQIPDITEGEYRDKPNDVIEQYGEYYTSGTEPYGNYNQYQYDDEDDEDPTDDNNLIDNSTDTGTGGKNKSNTEEGDDKKGNNNNGNNTTGDGNNTTNTGDDNNNTGDGGGGTGTGDDSGGTGTGTGDTGGDTGGTGTGDGGEDTGESG